MSIELVDVLRDMSAIIWPLGGHEKDGRLYVPWIALKKDLLLYRLDVKTESIAQFLEISRLFVSEVDALSGKSARINIQDGYSFGVEKIYYSTDSFCDPSVDETVRIYTPQRNPLIEFGMAREITGLMYVREVLC